MKLLRAFLRQLLCALEGLVAWPGSTKTITSVVFEPSLVVPEPLEASGTVPERPRGFPGASKNSRERSKADANAQMSALGIWEKADNLANPLHKRGLLSLNDALIPISTKTSESQIQHSLHQPPASIQAGQPE